MLGNTYKQNYQRNNEMNNSIYYVSQPYICKISVMYTRFLFYYTSSDLDVCKIKLFKLLNGSYYFGYISIHVSVTI